MVKGKFGPPRLAANLGRDLPPCSASYDSVESLCHSFSPGSEIQVFARKDSRCVVQADSRLWKNLSASLMHIDSGKIIGPPQFFSGYFAIRVKSACGSSPPTAARMWSADRPLRYSPFCCGVWNLESSASDRRQRHIHSTGSGVRLGIFVMHRSWLSAVRNYISCGC